MCGIMGYIGEENAVSAVISGLEILEYRGYDSAGLAFNQNNQTKIIKTVGSPSGLWNKTENVESDICIGHTRWATHGAANEINAHPHTSADGRFSVVHNGIIENYAELKAQLLNKGYKFKSETDTEVIAHLLEENYDGDLKGTLINVLPLLKGSYALGILCSDYPNTIICAKMSSPLFAGIGKNCSYLASDIAALADKSERIFRLNDGEISIIKKDEIKVFDTDGCRIRKTEVKIKAYEKDTRKGGYEHYMLKEINEQPTALRRTLSELIDGKKLKFKALKWSSSEIKNINNVCFVACGSAYHVGMVGAYACEELFKRTAKAEIASEFRYKNPHIDKNTLVVIISQSGETADTLAALRIAKEKNAKTVSIVNVENSTIALESDSVIMTRAGKEIAVATTKAYSAQLATVYSLIIYLSVVSNELSKKVAAEYIEELKQIPEKAEKILADTEYLKVLSKKALDAEYICFIGRGYDYCSANEASLKLKEISYITCEAYAAGELKHGTISLIDKSSLVVALSCSSELKSKITSNMTEVAARGAHIINVSDDESDADIKIPKTLDFLYPLLEIIPLQIFAYYAAKEKGCQIDKPRNLAKSVTVE